MNWPRTYFILAFDVEISSGVFLMLDFSLGGGGLNLSGLNIFKVGSVERLIAKGKAY